MGTILETRINEFNIRKCQPDDHSRVISVVKQWWNGRDLRYALPMLFFDHFADSSYVVYRKGQLVAFFIGFLSQSKKDEGYIHFAGVHPSFRGIGLGAHLYDKFFAHCRENQRRVVKSCTSPVNKGSIAFHTRMGFDIIPGDTEIDGVDVHLNYNRPDDSKVLFVKAI
jgi:ribosomal protein S18 acetylase RimI-like enzyme